MHDKKLLIITYYWPPSGGAAVQRWLSLANKLAALGWKITVLTVDEKYATYQLLDDSLLADVPDEIQVVKTKTFEPFGLYKLLFGKKSIPAPGFANETNASFTKKAARFIRGNFFIPDPRKYWKRFALPVAKKLVCEQGINTVITAGPPHSTHFIGKVLKADTGIRWFADFHDLWTDVIYYDMLYHLPFVKKKDSALEREILLAADKVLTVGERYREKLLTKIGKEHAEKIILARIGYDEQFVAQVEASPGINLFTIAYVGSIADYYQPEVFFKAVASIKDSYRRLRLKFVGMASPVIQELVTKYKLQDIYEQTGYVTHKEAVRHMKMASALLLVNPVTKDEAMVIPGKIYEYLAVGKPVINITTRESETASIIQQCVAGKTFERNEEAELANYLVQLIEGNLPLPDKQQVEKYSQARIASELGDMLSE